MNNNYNHVVIKGVGRSNCWAIFGRVSVAKKGADFFVKSISRNFFSWKWFHEKKGAFHHKKKEKPEYYPNRVFSVVSKMFVSKFKKKKTFNMVIIVEQEKSELLWKPEKFVENWNSWAKKQFSFWIFPCLKCLVNIIIVCVFIIIIIVKNYDEDSIYCSSSSGVTVLVVVFFNNNFFHFHEKFLGQKHCFDLIIFFFNRWDTELCFLNSWCM